MYRRRYHLPVYRLENKAGIGPYRARAEFSWVWREEEHNRSTGRPTPLEDGLLRLLNQRKSRSAAPVCFGFTTITQLQKWFSKKELKRLSKLGFKIQVYRPRVSYATRSQVLFVKAKSLRSVSYLAKT